MFLVRRGYFVLARNWACNADSVSIIAMDNEGCLVFIEVNVQENDRNGFPDEAPSASKRERFERIALAFFAEHEFVDIAYRFDCISLVLTRWDRAHIKHHHDFLANC